MSDKNKEIEIVTGDDTQLDVSPVYDHLNGVKPKIQEEKKNIIIPEVKSKNEDDVEDNNENHEEDNKE